MTDSRGIRDNNPGNLRPGRKPYLGEIDPENNYCRFISPEMGIRAMCKLLLVYQAPEPKGHGLRTIKAIINRWAPPADNNPTSEYVKNVAAGTGIDADADCDLSDASVLSSVVLYMIKQEQGVQPYAILIIERACSQAVGDGLEW